MFLLLKGFFLTSLFTLGWLYSNDPLDKKAFFLPPGPLGIPPTRTPLTSPPIVRAAAPPRSAGAGRCHGELARRGLAKKGRSLVHKGWYLKRSASVSLITL